MTAVNSRAYEQLHDLLKQLQTAEQMLEHGPRRIAVAQKKVFAAQAACDEQKEAIKQLKKSADQSALNLKGREAEQAKLALRLNEASSNKEYQIIQTQLESEKAADSVLEDEILVLLEKVDAAGEELVERENDLAKAEQGKQDITADVQQREPGLKSDVARLNGAIAEAEEQVPAGDARTTYRRLRAAQGASSLSPVEDDYCAECNTAVTPQDAVQLNLGEFLLCRACGRILYRPEQADG